LGVDGIALLSSKGINDTITTSGSSAVGSAGGISVVGVSSTIVTFFSDLDDTITALR